MPCELKAASWVKIKKMYHNEKNNDWVEVAATAAGVLIPILIRTLGDSSKK